MKVIIALDLQITTTPQYHRLALIGACNKFQFNFINTLYIMQNILCFSYERWDSVCQRPQHILTRLSRENNVYYFEEPKDGSADIYEVELQEGVFIIKIYINFKEENRNQRLSKLIDRIINDHGINSYSCWHYTTMALAYTSQLKPELTVYNCLRESSYFRFSQPEFPVLEDELFERADIVFTGGKLHFEANKNRHDNIHLIAGGVDKYHFKAARYNTVDPEDQKQIGSPRFGFSGVIDERFNKNLLKELSDEKPDWNFVIIGQILGIDVNDLPRADNIYYLGPKKYAELPKYYSHWDIAMLMFATNHSTEFYSSIETLEYLAAGVPVISTPVNEVVQEYGDSHLVYIANDAESFIKYGERELSKICRKEWLAKADQLLADKSWDNTFEEMRFLLDNIKKRIITPSQL